MLKTLATGMAFAIAALSFAPAAVAQQQPNLLIMGEDADLDSVPRNSRIFNRVLRAIEAEMQAEGFAVYDETAVTMGITDPGRVGRTDAELITVAVDPRSRKKGIGAALLKAALHDLTRTPARRLFLEVAADNLAALRLYGKHGFAKISERQGYYPRPDGQPATAIVMARDLG